MGSHIIAMTEFDAPYRLLLVEDDARLASSTREYLESHGYEVSTEYRGDTAVRRILRDKPDGIDVCRSVRAEFEAPILMLTARDDSMEQVIGLEIGADDYVVKPVVPRLLLARIRALLRHDRRVIDIVSTTVPTTAVIGNLHIDHNHRNVTWNNQPIQCTEVEFELLWVMATHAGQILSRDFLFRSLNGHDYDGIDRSIDIRVSRLRKKFETDLANPKRIKTVRGKGYVFVESAWS